MKGELHQRHLYFIERAKVFFEEDHRRVTYFTRDDELIALRYGDDNDCIRLFELGAERCFFHSIMKKCPVETVLKVENQSEYGDSHMFID